MTSEADDLKTNEFLRRRKLRLQQVREQSKDIAKKVRQRAKVAKLRQVVELDAKKQKEYLQRQEKLVKQLEDYYAKGIENLGASHRSASEVLLQDGQTDKVDASKQRGKEAAAELRRKRQEKLDEQKKLLDRKLQAREAANEISREKSTSVVNKVQSKAKVTEDAPPDKDGNTKSDNEKKLIKHDMATQWDSEEIPNEWEPNIPTLSLPKDDSVKETNNNVESKSDKSKRLDLFALSEEMPCSLRGGLTNLEERLPVKSSLTLVSEYLQNRGLRLRETDSTSSNKKMEELHSLKQTILRTRSSKEVSAKHNIDRSSKSSAPSLAIPRKPSVTMYNHATRDTRDIPYNERHVVRDTHMDEDAYSQAVRESSMDNNAGKEHHKKIQEIRSKVAVTKQNVEKEYRDTISFLNALPYDKGNKPIRTAYMDEHRQQKQRENHQLKLQQEYRKIEKECRKPTCRSKSKSPAKENDSFVNADFQYSWMPVPESDGNLAIHTIPTTVKEAKSGNTVKFSKVDSYHEYRSRHKHTPPTKDTQEKPKRVAEAVVVQSTSDSESVSSDTSSIENIQLKKNYKSHKDADKMSDAERIIIYKILDSKIGKKGRETNKLMKNIAKSLTLIENQKSNDEKTSEQNKKSNSNKNINNNTENRVFEQLNEGVYEAVNEKGDNITSMYFNGREGDRIDPNEDEIKHGRPCHCNKRPKKDQQLEKGTTLQWDSAGNPLTTRIPNLCSGCECGCQNVQPGKTDPVIQPSAATSASSFQTANNDKANNALPDGGYIKLIDDGGQGAGKFYIGASGFLKDDAYEVVIQLRKKGDEKDKSESKEVVIEKPEDLNKDLDVSLDKESVEIIGASSAQNFTEVPELKKRPLEPVVEVSTTGEIPSEKLSKEHHETVKAVPEVVIDPISKQKASSGNFNENVNAQPSNAPDVSEKGVCTSFQESFAIPSHVPKSDSMPRPGTSTYTQTSLCSPNQRPVFFHMSSSTSTAYMSPPEMILPSFLRNDYLMTDEDMYDPKNYEMQERVEVSEQQEYSEEYGCRCRKCMRGRKVTLSKINATGHRCRRSGQINMETPPNTARTRTDDGDQHFIEPKVSVKKICRKCETPHCNDGNSLHNHKKSRRIISKHSTENLVMRLTAGSASTKDSLSTSNAKKSNLKPTIKSYVDKLLALNREGLKAVQVVDQDCSEVTTPGSSIINVRNNIDHNKPTLENKISLEQIKNMLKEKILNDGARRCHKSSEEFSYQNSEICIKQHSSKNIKLPRLPRKKTIHKVKSLNISKNLLRTRKMPEPKQSIHNPVSSTSSSVCQNVKEQVSAFPSRNKSRSKSSPTPRTAPKMDTMHKSSKSDVFTKSAKQNKHDELSSKVSDNKISKPVYFTERKSNSCCSRSSTIPCHRATTTSTSPDSDMNPTLKRSNVEIPMSMSTQTSLNVDSEINFMKLAEDKLQNMEKIADLTEKCTQRLSNLAKVLEEVRKNKSLVYSQISSSDATSDSDQKSDKNERRTPEPQHEPSNNAQGCTENESPVITPADKFNEVTNVESTDYIPFLSDIPKPVVFKNLNLDLGLNSSSSSPKSNSSSPVPENYEPTTKNRARPPPALSRIHLKNVQDYVIPHELSTVVEVDSPMSLKLKSQSSRNDTKLDVPDSSIGIKNGTKEYRLEDRSASQAESKETNMHPDLIEIDADVPNQKTKYTTTESSDDSKIQMIDMKQFNEIMLKPFFSIHEYAKHCNIGALEDGSNLDDIVKDDQINDELSSLHSDGSLPDVISELLKRNIINEPFKFDTGSNFNSTTISSESTMSVLALSKARKDKKKSSVAFQNKENIAETSDTMSISSNPDLENAFKKLGMGWASSTLKKTKERLALSSSSNTSSTSLSQFKIRSFNQDIPALVMDNVSSGPNTSKKPLQGRNTTDNSKNAEQQTSLTNSMTVKEFLTNELAKKITFNKSRNETDEEFVSLFETKMPEEMKNASRMLREESYDNSMRSGPNNRARTSTPVQLFKSMTYHSSSSSNVSNGLFSNADDLSSVKVTSNSMKHSTSDKDDLIIPNFSLRMKKGSSECSKSD